MTPIDIHHFSGLLIHQLDNASINQDFSSTAPLYHIEHPALIKSRLSFQSEPSNCEIKNTCHNFNFIPIENLNKVNVEYRDLPIIKGTPNQVWRFMIRGTHVIFDFGPLGLALISQQPIRASHLDRNLQAYLLSTWLDYALSPELWSMEGKWTLFHNRITHLLKKYDLLVEDGQPGFYALKPKAKFLAESGYLGDVTANSYNLTLPWDFSLTQLENLEGALHQE